METLKKKLNDPHLLNSNINELNVYAEWAYLAFAFVLVFAVWMLVILCLSMPSENPKQIERSMRIDAQPQSQGV